jgi:hypothetical protein
MLDVGADTESRDVHLLRDIVPDALQIIRTAAEHAERILELPTRVESCDQMPIGLRDGELTIVSGHPGSGVRVAMQVATDQRWDELGHGLLLFSLDMTRIEIVSAMLCSQAPVDLNRVRGGSLTPADWTRLTRAANRLSGLNVWIDDTPGISMPLLRAKVARLQAEFDQYDPRTRKRKRHMGLVVVDPWDGIKELGTEGSRLLGQVAWRERVAIIANRAPPSLPEHALDLQRVVAPHVQIDRAGLPSAPLIGGIPCRAWRSGPGRRQPRRGPRRPRKARRVSTESHRSSGVRACRTATREGVGTAILVRMTTSSGRYGGRGTSPG